MIWMASQRVTRFGAGKSADGVYVPFVTRGTHIRHAAGIGARPMAGVTLLFMRLDCKDGQGQAQTYGQDHTKQRKVISHNVYSRQFKIF